METQEPEPVCGKILQSWIGPLTSKNASSKFCNIRDFWQCLNVGVSPRDILTSVYYLILHCNAVFPVIEGALHAGCTSAAHSPAAPGRDLGQASAASGPARGQPATPFVSG